MGIFETGLWFAAQQLTLQALIIGVAGVKLADSITGRTCKEMIHSLSVCVHIYYGKLCKFFKGKLSAVPRSS